MIRRPIDFEKAFDKLSVPFYILVNHKLLNYDLLNIMNFIGREEETQAIQNLLKRSGYQAGIIYGRRRTGKTELMKHCLENEEMPFIVFQCKESNERDNTNSLTELIRKETGHSTVSFENFMSAIEYLFEYAIDKPFCLVLDEYPYLRSFIEGCDSKFQEIIDKYAMKTQIKFFLLGSSISTMEAMLEHNNPLYMRFHLSILLKQMDYYDSAKFYPTFSNEDKIKLYSVFGGMPYYNAQISENYSVEENIIHILSGHFTGLKEYIETHLNEELRKINNANVVFEAIALGTFHFSDICSKTHIESSSALANILQKLIKMDLIEYVSPINDSRNKQKGGYRISDACVHFYYYFIYRNESMHDLLKENVFYDRYISEKLNSVFAPKAFEKVCKEYLVRKNRDGMFEPILENIGTYWYDNPKEKKNGQFDVVGKCDKGYLFFECKYTNSFIDDSIIKEEIDQVSKTSLKPCQYGFFSKNGFKLKRKYPYLFFTLQDLYK